jgi:hypothetical protein
LIDPGLYLDALCDFSGDRLLMDVAGVVPSGLYLDAGAVFFSMARVFGI